MKVEVHLPTRAGSTRVKSTGERLGREEGEVGGRRRGERGRGEGAGFQEGMLGGRWGP